MNQELKDKVIRLFTYIQSAVDSSIHTGGAISHDRLLYIDRHIGYILVEIQKEK